MTGSADWKSFSARLDSALELNPTEREAWLESLAREQPAHATRIRELLASAPAMERAEFLAGAVPAGDESSGLLGARVGPYAIESEIGRGGMSSVWRARRDDGRIEGFVAIKFVSLAAMGMGGEARFRREGLLLGRLDHPNIARLLDAGIHGETQQPYLVLEHVDGVPIDTHCDEARLTARARIELFLRVLAAVAHAHGHLVVHRDLKPSNILVTRDGTVKLLDFGIAKLLESDELTTRTGELALTPQYAAPEQVLGQAITTQTDVYALGLVLHRLLTGRHAVSFEGRVRADLVHAVVDADLPKPSTVEPGVPELRAELAGDLDNIVAKALRKAPAERYATATALAEDLARYLRFEPVTARPDTLSYRAAKFVRRNRGGVLAASLVTIALIAAAAIATWQMFEARRQRDLAQLEVARAKAQVDVMDQVLRQLPDAGEPLTPELLTDRSVAYVLKRFAGEPEFAVGFLIHLSGRYMNLGNTEKELATLVAAERIAERAREPKLLSRVECNTVETELAAGRPKLARARLARGLAAIAEIDEPSVKNRFDCLYAEARLLNAEGEPRAAITAATRAARLLEDAAEAHSPAYHSATTLLATLHRNQVEFAPALRWNQKGIDALAGSGLDRSESMAGALMNSSQILGASGQWADALAVQRDVIARVGAQGPAAEMHPREIGWLGRCLAETGEAEEALVWFARSAARARATGNDGALIAAILEETDLRVAAGQEPEARSLLTQAKPLIDRDPIANESAALHWRVTRAELALVEGDAENAARQAEAVLGDIDYPKRRKQRSLARALRISSAAALAAGDVATAHRRARDALDVALDVALDAERSADVGEAWLALARAERAAGKDDTERASATRAARILTAGRGAKHSSTREALAASQQPTEAVTPLPTP